MNKQQALTILASLGCLALLGAFVYFVFFNPEESATEPTQEVSVQAAPTQEPNSNPGGTSGITAGVGETGPFPLYVNGEPYSRTEEGVKQWNDTYNALLQGIRSEGNIAEAVGKNHVTDEVYAYLQGIPDGSYVDAKLESMEQITQESYEPFRMSQEVSFTGGVVANFKIGYQWDGKDASTGRWVAYELSVKPSK